ncbi:hypothetical protein PMAYCL1PPCAC_22519, partial [Pristionchus mayeri]
VPDRYQGIALMCVTATDFFSASLTGILSSWIVTNEIPWQYGLLAGPVFSFLPILGVFSARSQFRGLSNSSQRRSL